MTPREEIRAKQRIGPAGAALLYRLVYVVAVARNFPPPPGFQQWDESAVTETAHDFLDGERGRRRMTDIALRSVDEPSFERILETAVLNFLRDISRRTDMGRLVVRVKEILSEEPAFSSVARDRWALADGPAEPSTRPEPVLAASIAGAEVSVRQWNSARRAAPVADRASLVGLLRTVLTAAQGSLTPTDIARTIATRLDHRRTPLSVELDVLEGIAERSPATDPAEQAGSRVRAAQIFDALDDRDRIMVAHYEMPVRELEDILALRRSQAAVRRQMLTTRLRNELEDDADPEGTIAELRKRCERWQEERTSSLSATSLKHYGSGNSQEGKSCDEH
jgi:hypothetical protein